jgi:hypothetical protein
MSGVVGKGPVREQKICVECGFCCDGTLFLHATLQPGERGHLPEKIEANSYSAEGKDYFRLPCQYFSGKCTIYDSRRADVCSSYRCQLLKDIAEKRIMYEGAADIVKKAREIRLGLMEQYREISGNGSEINFMQMLIELGKVIKSAPERDNVWPDYEMLQARCNIFEALLIKHFRSVSDFEKLIMGSQQKENPE